MKKIVPFLLLLAVFSCTKENDADSPADEFYFKGTINTAAANWSSVNTPAFKITNLMNESGIGILTDDCVNDLCKQLDMNARVVTKTSGFSNSIMIAFTRASKMNDYTLIKSWLNPGLLPYGSNRIKIGDPVNDGVIINYTDENGRNWTSDLRISDQNGSSFESVALANAAPDKPYQKIWTARFSCKLYSTENCLPGVTYDMLTITNAEVHIPVFSR